MSRLRFGLFELDSDAGELRRNGGLIELDPQPFRLLLLLASEAPRLVTRDRIRAELWPNQPAGEFDVSTNSLIYQVRATLGDDSRNPRFIKTLRGGGYAFLAPVETIASTPAPVISPSPAADPAPSPATPPAAPAAPPRLRRHRGRWAAALATALGLAAAITWLSASRAYAPLQLAGAWQALTHDGREKDTILVVRRGWVYFNEVRDGHHRIARVAARGGPVELVAAPWPDAFLLDVTPDGTHLLVENPVPSDSMSEAPLWLLGTDDARRLNGLSAHAAAWSPDGQTILLARDRALWLADAAGGHFHRLLALPAQPIALAWSPDGTRFRFALRSTPYQRSSEWEADRDGSHQHTLGVVGFTQSEVAQAWRPDGRASLLISTAEPESGAWEFPASFWNWPRRLPPHRLDLGLNSAASPVAFDSAQQHLYRIGSASEGDVLRYSPTEHRFLPLAAGLSISYVDYSPRGNAVAYGSAPDGPLWRAQADFSHPQRLTPPGMSVELPRWSPDGGWIAFMGHAAGQPWNLDMVSADGGPVQQLLAGSLAGGMGGPTWAPDGASLVFGRANCPDTAACGITRLDLRSRTLTTLPGSNGLRTARLSPDGRYVAAIRSTREILVDDLRTGVWRQLAAVGSGDVLNWSHDSRYLFAFEPRGLQPMIFRIRLQDGAVTEVADLSAVGGIDDMVGGWFGLDPQDLPIVSRSTESREVFVAALAKP